MKPARLAACITVGCTAVATPLLSQGVRNVEGRVLSVADSTPLTDVRVGLVGASRVVLTDAAGRFVLLHLPRRTLSLAFDRIGVAPDTVALGADQAMVVVYLRLSPVRLAPMRAVAAAVARERFELVAQTSTISLEAFEITNTPTLAEPDVTRTVQLLPGTVAKNDFYVGFNVRGGETDQNLIQLDGVTVFNPSHVGGLFSSFDHLAVEGIEYVTGGFPARFGGRLSSVLDVKLRRGDSDERRIKGQVSLLSSKILLEGPIGASGASYMVGARRSYADIVARPVMENGFPYYFADALAKVAFPLPTGVAASFTGYWGRDALDWPLIEDEPGREGTDLVMTLGNRLAGLTVLHQLGSVELEQHVSASFFSTALAIEPAILRSENAARVVTARASASWSSGPRQYVRVGGGVDGFSMEYRQGSEALETTDFDLRYGPRVWSAYVDAQLSPFSWLMLRPGVRMEHVGGGADRTTWAPRAAVKAFVTEDLALTGSAGRFYQAVHSIRDQDAPLTLFEFWIGANDVTPVAWADHLVLGFEGWLREGLSLSVEGYTKRFSDLVIKSFRDDPKVRGDEFSPATGQARGVDVLLRQYAGRWTGWIAYGYSKTERVADGVTFVPAHDRRHTLNLVLQGPGPAGGSLGARFGYGSGLPYTGIVGEWLHRHYNSELGGFDWYRQESLSTEINGERFPYYARLDLGLRWQVEKWGGVLKPYVQVVNAFNRSNVWVYAFDYNRAPPRRTGLSQLPFFPSVGVEFEW